MGTLLSPVLHVDKGPENAPRVALTLDACTGQIDNRILSALIGRKIKATIFVTARWLKRNPEALAALNAHPELFAVENHGAQHLAAIDTPGTVFSIKTAGSDAAIQKEILGGALAIKTATGRQPIWYRGATAVYSKAAIADIEATQFKLAGYSLSGDGGASYSARRAAAVIAGAKNGDVIIAHINQPTKPAGMGVVAGLIALQTKGFVFVDLDETATSKEPTKKHQTSRYLSF